MKGMGKRPQRQRKDKENVTMEKKKRKFGVKKILLTVLIAVLLFTAVDIIVTKIYTQDIPHRFATAEEGRQIMLANTDYYNDLSQNDIDFRLRKTGGTRPFAAIFSTATAMRSSISSVLRTIITSGSAIRPPFSLRKFVLHGRRKTAHQCVCRASDSSCNQARQRRPPTSLLQQCSS